MDTSVVSECGAAARFRAPIPGEVEKVWDLTALRDESSTTAMRKLELPALWEDEDGASLLGKDAEHQWARQDSTDKLKPDLSTIAHIDGAPAKKSSKDLPASCGNEDQQPRLRRLSTVVHVDGDAVAEKVKDGRHPLVISALATGPPSCVKEATAEVEGDTTPCSTVTQLAGKAYADLASDGNGTPTSTVTHLAGVALNKATAKRDRLAFLSMRTHVNGELAGSDTNADMQPDVWRHWSNETQLNGETYGNPRQDGSEGAAIAGTFADPSAVIMAKAKAARKPVVDDLSTKVHVEGDTSEASLRALVSSGIYDAHEDGFRHRLELMSAKSSLVDTPCAPIWEDDEGC
mmetsp:Transcript_50170/g.144567  ORF Transcript_50170/g.144567 Transcript_50170/m.144567 type:complete len:347 (+) Transcript_50170:180-1220(+)